MEILVRVLDDAVRIPGTRLGVGLDALVGLVFPALGDLAAGMASLVLLVVAWRRRVPPVAIARMVLNTLIDTLVGVLPVGGDLFDLWWRSNRRNLELIRRYERAPGGSAAAGDTLAVAAGLAVVVAALLLPFCLLLLHAATLLAWLGA